MRSFSSSSRAAFAASAFLRFCLCFLVSVCSAPDDAFCCFFSCVALATPDMSVSRRTDGPGAGGSSMSATSPASAAPTTGDAERDWSSSASMPVVDDGADSKPASGTGISRACDCLTDFCFFSSPFLAVNLVPVLALVSWRANSLLSAASPSSEL